LAGGPLERASARSSARSSTRSTGKVYTPLPPRSAAAGWAPFQQIPEEAQPGVWRCA
jgi:hypothetical protein